MYRKFTEVWPCRADIYERTDIYMQTDRHTDTLIAVLRTLANGEVTIRLHKGTYRLCFNHATSVCRPIVLASLGRHLGLPSYTLGLCLRCIWPAKHARLILVNIINLRGMVCISWMDLTLSTQYIYLCLHSCITPRQYQCIGANLKPTKLSTSFIAITASISVKKQLSEVVWKLLLWSPYVIGQTIIFSCCCLFFFLLLLLLFFLA